VLHHAIAEGCGAEFLESFLRGVFAEGIDAGSRRGLQRIAGRAGMNAYAVARALDDPSWRSRAQQHRDRMQRLGLWGVPSFQVNDRPGLWGQDRLFMVEQDLASA
jgi:2-hydroxychromene-2-carboxylate isomerase